MAAANPPRLTCCQVAAVPETSVYFSEWNSSELVKSTTRWQEAQDVTPTTFSLLQLPTLRPMGESDFASAQSGVIVVADRYAFTALARRGARRGRQWCGTCTRLLSSPILRSTFVPLDIAVDRILMSRAKLKYYEAGMDWAFPTTQ